MQEQLVQHRYLCGWMSNYEMDRHTIKDSAMWHHKELIQMWKTRQMVTNWTLTDRFEGDKRTLHEKILCQKILKTLNSGGGGGGGEEGENTFPHTFQQE
jgi:hypothetical protein